MAKSKNGKSKAAFDLDDPKLPAAIEDAALGSGGYPYEKKMKKDAFKDELKTLQIELARLQSSLLKSGERIVCLFEGRDSAGKGTCINHFVRHLNPRHCKVVALGKPTETEQGQWYFQRYASHLPTAGDMALFDRSWYNRAGVESVMGFCTPAQQAKFLREAPQFEGMLARDGIRLFKFYLEIGREMQLMRFHERRHDPLKQWKISDIDLAAVARFDDYSAAKEEMFRFTHTPTAPWTVIFANDQRRARLEAIRAVLHATEYKDKDAKAVGTPDASIVGAGPKFFETK
ncbi:MAG: polyphosphate kinase 2 [Hyphomicrobiaceae bacterium]